MVPLLVKRVTLSVPFYSVGMIYGCMMVCRFLWTILWEGRQIFKSTPRQAPACLVDKSLGVHNYVTTKSNVKFHYVANGEVGKPLMLFLHGFVEFWYSWRSQLKEFSKDYRVVAIDMRGYGFSDKPVETSQYKFTCLAQDIKEIVDALGYSSCTLVGHDWGGFISWYVAHRFPETVDKLVVISSAHPRIIDDFNWEQFFKSWYVFMFQLPYIPELYITMKDFIVIENTFRGKYSGGMTDVDVEAYKFSLSQPGAVTGALNYYRNLVTSHVEDDWIEDSQARVTSPTLIIWADEDPFLSKRCLDVMPKFVENLTIKYVDVASHWVHLDKPQIVNDFIREFVSS